MVAAASRKMIVIADHSKLVKQLGAFPLPIEVVPYGFRKVREKLLADQICTGIALREEKGKPFITDHHHYILDCQCNQVADPFNLNNLLHNIPGIVETGLFVNMANEAIVGYPDGRIETIRYR
jgi:ribose 5-phosphate isomerase A